MFFENFRGEVPFRGDKSRLGRGGAPPVAESQGPFHSK